MDSLTHIVAGACIGELFLGRQLGKKAMLWGAITQSLPDIDFVTSFWMGTPDSLLAHRGFTHSFLFAAICTVLLAMLAVRWHRKHDVSIGRWMLFIGTEIFGHLLLDSCNAYGTGWFEPFSHQRISFDLLFVADPFFSVWPAIAFVALLIIKRNGALRKRWAGFAIILSLVYVVIGGMNKWMVNKSVKAMAMQDQIHFNRYFITPAPLNNLLWYVVLEDTSGYHIGYRSVFDNRPMSFQFFPRNDEFLAPVRDQDDVRKLIRFSNGYYTLEKWKGRLVFNDLRFGEIMGWKDNSAHFVFHYFLEHAYSNDLVVQRGRFANWNKKAIGDLWRRMWGDDNYP